MYLQFIQALKDGDLETVKTLLLLYKDEDVNAFDDAPLFWAVSYGHLEVVKYLVAEGDDVHANDDEALRWAAAEGNFEVVKYLIEDHDADVHAWEDASLRSAAYYGHLEIVKYLVEECGANVHAEDDCALRNAVYHGHLEVVKYLKSYHVSQFTKRHIDKQIQIEKLNQVLKGIRAFPPLGVDYLYAVEQFNHLKLIY